MLKRVLLIIFSRENIDNYKLRSKRKWKIIEIIKIFDNSLLLLSFFVNLSKMSFNLSLR